MFLLLIIGIGIFLYYSGNLQRFLGNVPSSKTQEYQTEARKALDLRYASGEIDSEEYTKIKNLL